MEKIKDNIAFIWFILSSIAVAALAYMFQKRGEKIATLVYEVQKNKIAHKLENAVSKLQEKEGNYGKAVSNYNDIKRRYGHLLPSPTTPPTDSSGKPGDGTT